MCAAVAAIHRRAEGGAAARAAHVLRARGAAAAGARHHPEPPAGARLKPNSNPKPEACSAKPTMQQARWSGACERSSALWGWSTEGFAGFLGGCLDSQSISVERNARQDCHCTRWSSIKRVPSQPGATACVAAQVVDERLAGSSVEYLQLNELSEALQRNLQSMHRAKCLFMMRAWHQARPRTGPVSQQNLAFGTVVEA